MGKEGVEGNFLMGCDPNIIALLMSDKLSEHEKEDIFKQNPNYKVLIENGIKIEKSILEDFEDLKKLASKSKQ